MEDDLKVSFFKTCFLILTSCNRLVINKLISGCVRMAWDSLLGTSLLQVVNRLVLIFNMSVASLLALLLAL